MRLDRICRQWLADLLKEADSFGRAFSLESPVPSIVTRFGYLFLRTTDPKMWSEFVATSMSDEFIYIVMAEDFEPKHLLNLSKISKQDFEWGHYMDLFTDADGTVVSWYSDSAAGFGSVRKKFPSGLTARLSSYFPGSIAATSFEHERYLRGEKGKRLYVNLYEC